MPTTKLNVIIILWGLKILTLKLKTSATLNKLLPLSSFSVHVPKTLVAGMQLFFKRQARGTPSSLLRCPLERGTWVNRED